MRSTTERDDATKYLLFPAALALAAATPASTPAGTMPDMTKLYHSRQNCHLAYDLSIETLNANGSLSAEEVAFGKAYEANAKAGTPCPKPPADLARRSANRTVSTKDGLQRLVLYNKQKDPTSYFETGLSLVAGKVPGVEKTMGFSML